MDAILDDVRDRGWVSPPGGLPGSRLRRVTEFIQEHLDQPITLAQLGRLVNMSPYHFARLFKRSTGLPPHRFVMRQRIERATRLLSARELAVSQIAQVVGFRTASHFTTVFRRMTGITPREYRASCPVAGAPEYDPSFPRGPDR
jgi:AraC family transcriptional regulator